MHQSAAQKVDMRVCGEIKNAGLLDFVAAWYIKAANYLINNAHIKCAFVSTNSITQGEQVGVLWAWMLAQGVKINFADQTFIWNNEARGKAAVHCVIVGFGLQYSSEKVIYEYEDTKGEPHAVKVSNIIPYLADAPNIVMLPPTNPICNNSLMLNGIKSTDGGNLIFQLLKRKN